MKKALNLTFQLIIVSTYQLLAQNVGIGTTSPLARLHVADSSVVFTAVSFIPSPGNPPVSGEGRRMMWYADKAAFRVGYVYDVSWDKDSTGEYSFAAGYGVRASGKYSTAMGIEAIASGEKSFATGYNTTASGIHCTAMGFSTIARSNASTAMGYSTTAIGGFSTATGFSTIAGGLSSTAMGNGTTASGDQSTAIGYLTTASGSSSTAMGQYATAIGPISTAMGYSTLASGNVSNAMGWQTTAKSYISTAIGRFNDTTSASSVSWIATDPLFIVGNGSADNARSNAATILKNGNTGIGTVAPKARLHVVDSSVVFSAIGTLPANPSNPPVSGAGRRMMWYPDKAAFRAGYAFSTEWDKDNIGGYSFATGNNVQASGQASIAMGSFTIASSAYSTAMGDQTNASGYTSTATGYHTLASGSYSTAMGFTTTARGYASTVVGIYNNPIVASPEDVITPTTPLFTVGNGDDVNNRSNAMVVLKNGNTGIGNIPSPANMLHIFKAGSGVTPNANANLVVESNTNNFINILGPSTNENGILFGVTGNSTSGGIIYNSSNSRKGLQFRTGGNTFHMVLDSTGKLGIGLANPTHQLQLSTDDAAKPGTSTWTVASDERLKTNISDFKDGLAVLNKINPIWFEYNGDAGLPTGVKTVGILAQEIKKIAPYMIGSYNHEDAQGNATDYLSFNPNSLFYILVNSVKELSTARDEENAKLKMQNVKLEDEIALLAGRLKQLETLVLQQKKE